MRFLAIGSLTILFAVVALGQRQIPPGVRQADHAIAGADQPIDSTMPPARVMADPAAVRAEAAQLQSLAAALPGQVDQVTKGVLPKDLNGNLKKIEKLAKRLRLELTP